MMTVAIHRLLISSASWRLPVLAKGKRKEPLLSTQQQLWKVAIQVGRQQICQF